MSLDSAIAETTRTSTTTDSNNHHQPQKEIVFITLGDGDFTWSLDFGRYLLTSLSASVNDISERRSFLPQEFNSVRLIATGIDSLLEFQQKYRNYNYILRELEQLNTKARMNNNLLKVEVLHEINAIVQSPKQSIHHPQGHVIIFNHPHLGTEDAQLHSQFLCHLFHSVHQFWIVPSVMGGAFYLTLANGQYERWECHTAAQRHGMKLLQQSPFVANPSIAGWKSVYGHRRHQTGKSFASRTSGSTTYLFVRDCDDTTNVTNSLAHIRLPWFVATENSNFGEITSLRSSFVCFLCDKQFKEGRSLKNHILSAHNNKRKRSESDATTFVCHHCNDRCFDSLEALNDHVLAKHNGIHSTIVPDWVARHTVNTTALSNDRKMTQPFGTCSICNAIFSSTNDETNHHNLFIPTLVDTINKVTMRQCRFCQKSFQQVRAQQQHENVCSSRLKDGT
jgi:Domain of unknown function (DUF2431)